MHLETDSGVGVGGLVGLFSPDWSRLIYGFEPLGWIEGIAVFRESELVPGAGRLDAPSATMRYRAAVGSDDPWSVGELLYSGRFERPTDRHYIGGGQLLEHLIEREDGTGVIRRTNQWFHRLPFLGFGAALWIGTGSLPHQISDSFLEAERQKEAQRLDALTDVTDVRVVAGTDGLHLRRPQWLGDSTLVAYGSGYSTRPGFYRIDLESGRTEALRHEGITEGYAYQLGPDTTALFFSRLHTAPLIARQTTQRPHRIDLRSGEVRLISPTDAVFAPAKSPDGPVYAARRDGAFSTLVTLRGNGAAPLVSREGLRYKQIAPSPSGDRVAVLANDGDHQGIYRLSGAPSEEDNGTLRPWLRFGDGMIYDLCWGPDGRYLLFAGDPSGTPNVYALDTDRDRVLRLTTVRYGALEPALSPDGTTLVFSRYRHERFELVTTPFRPASAEPAERVERNWSPPNGLMAAASSEASSVPRAPGPGGPGPRGEARATPPPDAAPDSASLAARAQAVSDRSRPYRAWRHLAPRTVLPVLSGNLTSTADPGEDLGTGVGLQLRGVDPLRTWTYTAEGLYQADRLWGRASVATGLLPGTPSLTLFNEPVERAVTGPTGVSRVAAIEERGLRLGIQQRVVLEKNVYSTTLTGGLEGIVRQTRPISASSVPEGPFTERLTLEPELTLRYRTQRNLRDLVPNTGVVSTAEAEADVATPAGVDPSRALRTEINVYWPFLSDLNGGLRTSAAVLTQNDASLFDPDAFVPRGYQGVGRALPGSGTHLRVDLKYTQPLWFVNTGSVLLPVALDAIYGFALGQAQYRASAAPNLAFTERRAAVGGGLGLAFRPFGFIPLNLEVGVSYAIDPTPGQSRWASYVGL
jgi:Tol biopolymer transport system component